MPQTKFGDNWISGANSGGICEIYTILSGVKAVTLNRHGDHRRIADAYCGGAAVTKFPTKAQT